MVNISAYWLKDDVGFWRFSGLRCCAPLESAAVVRRLLRLGRVEAGSLTGASPPSFADLYYQMGMLPAAMTTLQID